MIYAVKHALGVSLVQAQSDESAIKKARLRFGTHAAPFFIPKNQDDEISWAKAMGAGVIGLFLIFFLGTAQAVEGWPTVPMVKGPSDPPARNMDCSIWVDKHDGIHMEGGGCPVRVVDKDGSTHFLLICYLKMKDAMRDMEFLHTLTLGELSTNKTLQETISKPYMLQWEQTVKECVK